MSTERRQNENNLLLELVSIERQGKFTTIGVNGFETTFGVLKDELDIFYNTTQFRELTNLNIEDRNAVYNIDLNDGGKLIVPKVGIDETGTLEKPLKMSIDSDAKYLIKTEADGIRILFQYLDGQTTRHYHDKEELVIPQSDRLYAKNSEVRRISSVYKIPPFEEHELFSVDSPRLAIIVQEAEITHVHQPKTSLTELRNIALALNLP